VHGICHQRTRRLLQIAEAVFDQRTVSDVFVAGSLRWAAGAWGPCLDRGAICAILSGRRLLMTIHFGTALAVCALLASLTLAFNGGGRLLPVIALVACALQVLIAFRIIQLSSSKVRVDVILPAILVLTGGICWSRSATKSTITGATVVTMVGLIQLLLAIHVFR
jgi:hypothetical protein